MIILQRWGKTCALIERVENGEYSLEELEKSADKGTYLDAGGRIIPIKINGLRRMYVVISGIKDKDYWKKLMDLYIV